jgi:Ni/Fe-hydrogenase subunit HybB-like protein
MVCKYPEEITYFITRIEMYNLPFFGAVVMNFVFPILILINSDFKRISWILVMAGVVILAGHYIDFFQYGYAWYGWRQMVYRSVRDCFRNVLSWFIYLCCVYIG